MIEAHAIRHMQSVYDCLFAGRAAHADGNQFALSSSRAESFVAFQYLVRSLGPHERLRVAIVDGEVVADRTDAGLPMKKGRLGTMTHDYKRNGNICLFATLEMLQCKVIRLLRRLDTEFPGKIMLHLLMDNYGTQKHPNVQTWFKRHSRFVPHFVPTSSSWLNLVEPWLGELTSKANRRGSFRSVADVHLTINKFLEAWNEDPKPFLWTATVESIHAKLGRYR